jgi:hypothetical protein
VRRSDRGKADNAGDAGNADNAGDAGNADMSEAISDVDEASKPGTMTGDAGSWCISGS